MRLLVLIAQFHLLIFSCAVWGFDLTAGFKAEDLIYPASLLILLICVWSIWSWNLFNRSLFDPYTLFLTSVAVFNGGQAFLEVFHLNENGILNGTFASETILKSLLLVAMGISGLHLGALLSAGMIRQQPSPGRMVRSCRWPSVRTAAAWPPPGPTPSSGSGTSRRKPTGCPCAAMPTRFSPPSSAPTDGRKRLKRVTK